MRSQPSAHIKARADFFFKEQCKRLGPITIMTPNERFVDQHERLHTLFALQQAAHSPAPARKRGRPRKTNPGG